MDDLNSIETHFDDEEWSRLTTLEKTRLMNIKRNYEMMKSAGLSPKVPPFMLKRRKSDVKYFSNELRKGDVPCSHKASLKKALEKKISEADWGVQELKFTRSDKKQISVLLERAEKNLESLKSYFSLRKVQTTIKDEESSNQQPRRRYPKRKVPKVCYTEEKKPCDDDFLYCEDCGREYGGDCPVHGPLTLLTDRKVPLGHCSDRAVRTCPLFLSVCRSGIRGAGLGIWTEILLPKGIIFGPYQGKHVKNRKQAEVTGHAWEVGRCGSIDHYVEGSESLASNWLRFVNSAQHEEHQNLVAFQYDDLIFYKTYKKVMPFTELLVWYGDEYAAELGIDFNEDDPGVGNTGNTNPFCSTRRFLGVPSDPEENSRSNFFSFGSNNISLQNNSGAIQDGHNVGERSRNKETGSITGFGRRCEKSHVCINCGETFGDRWNLELHQQIHAEKNTIGEVPSRNAEFSDYDKKGGKCLHCTYTTTRPSQLKRHVNAVDLGQKPFKCPHCEYTAAQSCDLKKHATAVHLGHKCYKCPHCEYRAAYSSNLKKHMNVIHLRQKPYKCPHCEYRAGHSSNVKTHITVIHLRQKSYKCPSCEYSTSHLKSYAAAAHLGQKRYK